MGTAWGGGKHRQEMKRETCLSVGLDRAECGEWVTEGVTTGEEGFKKLEGHGGAATWTGGERWGKVEKRKWSE